MPTVSGIPDSVGLRLSVVSENVFDSSVKSLRWIIGATIGGIDVSAQIEGSVNVTATEDAARIASFSLMPSDSAQFAWFDNQPVTIDVQLNSGAGWEVFRLFTGVVENKFFNPANRVCELSCRDGYQEIPASCTSPEAVETLFGGLSSPSRLVLPWDADNPDSVSYFNGLLDTMLGGCAITSNGLWRPFAWRIGTPMASFTLADVMDDSVKFVSGNRVDSPSTIKAVLTHRFYRLHNVETAIYWTAPSIIENIVNDLKLVPRSVVLSAVDAVSNWYVKGKLTITPPPIGSFDVTWGGVTVTYPIYEPDSNSGIWELNGWFYRRWYQEIEAVYTTTIDLGGSSGREEIVSASMAADFDAGAWESPAAVDTPLDIYARNVPAAPAGPTGYEALSEPWPPANGHLDYYGDVDGAALENAMRHVTAKAVRKAIAGRRSQRIEFDRPLDPRFEIGDIIAVDLFSLTGAGQAVELVHSLDCDTGDAITHFRIACPDGNSTDAALTVDITPHVAVVNHSLTGIPTSNHFGSATTTTYLAPPADANLAGWFCNVGGLSENYDIATPVYNEQFRIVLPEIPAELRDPIRVDEAVSTIISIPDAQLTISF